MPFRQVGLGGLLDYINEFVKYKGYKNVHDLGNSLGGHISLLYVLSQQQNVASMTLAGSSGLFENAFGSTFPKRGNYEFIKDKTEATFYNKEVATKFKEHVLSKGGTENPMVLYKRFRGSEPKVEALLERAGLLSD